MAGSSFEVDIDQDEPCGHFIQETRRMARRLTITQINSLLDSPALAARAE
jgi:hypothetical protein